MAKGDQHPIRRAYTAGPRGPSLKGTALVYARLGKPVIRAWPRKRGPPKSYKQRFWVEWFREAVTSRKHVAPAEQARALELNPGLGLYPMDWIMAAMSGNFVPEIVIDGVVWKRFIPMVHPVMFQGFRLLRSTNVALSGGTSAPIDWELPQLDTANFWTPGAPHLITIPEGVEIISLTAGVRYLNANAGTYAISIRQNGTILYVGNAEDLSGNHTIACATGPIPVTEGDTFLVRAFNGAANTIEASPATFFSGQILSANP